MVRWLSPRSSLTVKMYWGVFWLLVNYLKSTTKLSLELGCYTTFDTAVKFHAVSGEQLADQESRIVRLRISGKCSVQMNYFTSL